MLKYSVAPFAIGAGLLAVAPNAHAEEAPVTWSFVYKGDVSGVVAGGNSQAGRYLDNVELSADVPLDQFGWRNAHVFAHILSNSGGAPNDIAETLQGVDNIEVARPRAKLYQFWVEQEFMGGQASVLAGLYDLNSEFYANDSAGLLLAPAFGIGSELAATGPNGPSIFPSTALTVRARWQYAAHQQVQFAVLNAEAGVVGDPGGVDNDFDNGALIIGEWAYTGDITLKLGVWSYTDRQDDIRDVDGLGDPLQRRAQGAYASIEGSIFGGQGDVRQTKGFLRLGGSEGDTTPFTGGWQAGVLVSHVLESRPDSAFSLGLNQGYVSADYRDNLRDDGENPAHAESAIELTYADKLGEHLTLQPDLQLIHDAGAISTRDDVVVATLRVLVEF